MTHPRRILILPAAAIIIFTLSAWRISNPRRSVVVDVSTLTDSQPAPAFELYDQDSRVFKVESWLHRHAIAVAFFDGTTGPEADSNLIQLRKYYPAIERAGIKVVAVSTLLPQQIRNDFAEFPFPILSDIGASNPGSVHRQWGCLAQAATPDSAPRTRPAVFLIDGAGRVAWRDGAPAPLDSDADVMKLLLASE